VHQRDDVGDVEVLADLRDVLLVELLERLAK